MFQDFLDADPEFQIPVALGVIFTIVVLAAVTLIWTERRQNRAWTAWHEGQKLATATCAALPRVSRPWTAPGPVWSLGGPEIRPDAEITARVPADSDTAWALAAMKAADPAFSVADFLRGARVAYGTLLVAQRRGEVERLKALLSTEAFQAFAAQIARREQAGLTAHPQGGEIYGIRIEDARFDARTPRAEITVGFVSDDQVLATNGAGQTVFDSMREVYSRRVRHILTFERILAEGSPSWMLVATDRPGHPLGRNDSWGAASASSGSYGDGGDSGDGGGSDGGCGGDGGGDGGGGD